jgi:hypothetical protein
MKKKDVLTKGNVIVNEIKVGDIHYEYSYNIGTKLEVVSTPIRIDSDESWEWNSKRISDGMLIAFYVKEGLEYYSANIYDYEAYKVKVML